MIPVEMCCVGVAELKIDENAKNPLCLVISLVHLKYGISIYEQYREHYTANDVTKWRPRWPPWLQDGRHDLSISLGLTSDDLVTRSVSPRKVS